MFASLAVEGLPALLGTLSNRRAQVTMPDGRRAQGQLAGVMWMDRLLRIFMRRAAALALSGALLSMLVPRPTEAASAGANNTVNIVLGAGAAFEIMRYIIDSNKTNGSVKQAGDVMASLPTTGNSLFLARDNVIFAAGTLAKAPPVATPSRCSVPGKCALDALTLTQTFKTYDSSTRTIELAGTRLSPSPRHRRDRRKHRPLSPHRAPRRATEHPPSLLIVRPAEPTLGDTARGRTAPAMESLRAERPM